MYLAKARPTFNKHERVHQCSALPGWQSGFVCIADKKRRGAFFIIRILTLEFSMFLLKGDFKQYVVRKLVCVCVCLCFFCVCVCVCCVFGVQERGEGREGVIKHRPQMVATAVTWAAALRDLTGGAATFDLGRLLKFSSGRVELRGFYSQLLIAVSKQVEAVLASTVNGAQPTDSVVRVPLHWKEEGDQH